MVAAALGPVAGLGAARVVALALQRDRPRHGAAVRGRPAGRGRRRWASRPTRRSWAARARRPRAGAVDNEAADEDDALDQLRRFLSYLPDNVWEAPPLVAATDPADRREEELLSIVPRDARKPYKMRAHPRGRARPRLGVRARRALRRLADHLPGAARRPAGRACSRPTRALRRRADRARRRQAGPLRRHVRPVPPAGRELRRPAGLRDRHRVGARRARSAAARAALYAVYQATVPWVSILVRKVFGIAGAGHGDGSRLNLRYAWPSRRLGLAADRGRHRGGLPARARGGRRPRRAARRDRRAARTRCARRSARPSASASRRSSTRATPARSCATGPSARTSWCATSCTGE